MHRSVDHYIEALPSEKQIIATAVRDIIVAVPGIEEKFSFKIPFYHYFGMLCYINNTKNGLDIGFCRGKDLVLAFPQLNMKDRAMVASIELQSVADIVTFDLAQIIHSAAAWNIEAKQNGITFLSPKSTSSRRK
jgi:hypothetical protein